MKDPSFSVSAVILNEVEDGVEGAGDVARTFRVSKEENLALAAKAHQPMSAEPVTFHLDRVKLDHQILRLAIRVDSFEGLNGKT